MKKNYFFFISFFSFLIFSCQNNENNLKEKELELKIKEVELEKEKLKTTENNIKPSVDNNTSFKNTEPKESNFYARGAGKYPQGSERRINYNDIQYLSNFDLRIMRNEIFARHGYIFKSQDLIEYFNHQSWYRPLYYNVDSKLSTLETDNINFIKSFEN